jgi:hypothetical protein
MITFECEVVEVKAKKTGIDKEFKVVLITDQDEVLKLQAYICNKPIKLEVQDE